MKSRQDKKEKLLATAKKCLVSINNRKRKLITFKRICADMPHVRNLFGFSFVLCAASHGQSKCINFAASSKINQ